ncbi:MAG: DUF896 domain-containing protein [Clostridia bacterium]|nr:DUF896 domain-containing protein [Clostridia bacterium]
MDQNERLERINELARKERESGLTPEEKAEQAALREEYRIAFREALRGRLENTYLLRPDGTKEPLRNLRKRNG